MASRFGHTEVIGDSLVVTTAEGLNITFQLSEGQGAELVERDDGHLLHDVAKLAASSLGGVQAMIAAPNAAVVCHINGVFADALAFVTVPPDGEVADPDEEDDFSRRWPFGGGLIVVRGSSPIRLFV